MADKQGELFPEDEKPKSTKRKRRKSNDLSIEDRAKIRTQRKQQADVVTEQEKFRDSEREYWKKKNQEDFGKLKIESGPDYAKDKKDNQDFDQILNPDGSYRKPSLGQLREGVDWKKRANQLLMIGAGGAAIVGQGLKSLLINPYGGI